ncbi:MAG: serine/threonine protein kinase [Cyanobacteria bacterium HKST-UBA02]|nr:serine/threonine protein kinase [Cyanobacteria bacterium HKST-UBA02]
MLQLIEGFPQSEKLAERYEPLELLGHGGVGVVFRVRDRLLDKDVALKVLRSGLSHKQIMRFQKEAKALARLNHEGIVKVLDFGMTESSQPYLVCDFIDGRSLAELLEEQGSMDLPDALELFSSICSAMRHAHGMGVLHRDLKPGNVMIEDGRVRIVDFGLARLKDREGKEEQTPTGQPVGSPLYMAPEQSAGSSVDERADIYSMGCLMNAVLTGAPPFVGETVLETTMMHRSQMPPGLAEQTGREWPAYLEQTISRCLAKEREDRFVDFAGLEAALNAGDAVPTEADDHAASSGSFTPGGVFFIVAGVSAVLIFAVVVVAYLVRKPPAGAKAPVSSDLAFMEPLVTDKVNYQIDTSDNLRIIKIQSLMSDAELKRILEREQEGLKGLNYRDCDIPQSHIEIISGFPFERLDFRHARLDSTELAIIAGMKSLRRLSLLGVTGLQDEDLACLEPTPMTWLHLSGPSFSEQALGPVSRIKTLSGLEVDKMKLGGEAIARLGKLENLSEIIFNEQCDLGDDAWKALRGLKHLNVLQIHNCLLGTRDLDRLSTVPCSKLTFYKVRFEKGSLEHLAGNKHIRALLFHNCRTVDSQVVAWLRAHLHGVEVAMVNGKERETGRGLRSLGRDLIEQ